jgi:hypothetical protein
VPEDVTIRVDRSTVVTAQPAFWLPLYSPVDSNLPSPPSFHVDTSDCVFDCPHLIDFAQTDAFLDKSSALTPDAAEAVLLRLLQWQGQRNAFAAGANSVRWNHGAQSQPPHGPQSLEDWGRFWGTVETDSQEGSIHFEGGNLRSRVEADLDRLTPDDFRLRPDSAGYRAGPDGNDLGADIDLVGPGAGYERWKKTPGYQEWLKDTGQMQ